MYENIFVIVLFIIKYKIECTHIVGNLIIITLFIYDI